MTLCVLMTLYKVSLGNNITFFLCKIQIRICLQYFCTKYRPYVLSGIVKKYFQSSFYNHRRNPSNPLKKEFVIEQSNSKSHLQSAFHTSSFCFWDIPRLHLQIFGFLWIRIGFIELEFERFQLKNYQKEREKKLRS